VDITYNTAGQRRIPAADVAQLSEDSAAKAASGYDRNWPSRRASQTSRRLHKPTAPGFHGRAPNMHSCPNDLSRI